MTEILTAVQQAIKEYGEENISMVGYNYHGRYEDDDCNFTYYNNVTGTFFYDEWTTRFVCPNYANFECQTLKAADEKGYVDHEKLYNFKKAQLIEFYTNMKINDYVISEFYDEIAQLGLRVEVKGGRKWKGIGFLVGTFKTSYQWGTKMWRSNNDYGTSTTRHAKVYDPLTNRIETVTANQVKFLDLDKIIKKYKSDMIVLIEATTVDDLTIGRNGTLYSPYSGDSNTTPININCNLVTFKEYLKTKGNNINLDNAYDVLEEEKKMKLDAFKETKMPEIIEWVKANTDKEGDEIQKLAEHIFNKRYC